MVSTYIVANPKGLPQAEGVGFPLFPDVHVLQYGVIHLPCDSQVIRTLAARPEDGLPLLHLGEGLLHRTEGCIHEGWVCYHTLDVL